MFYFIIVIMYKHLWFFIVWLLCFLFPINTQAYLEWLFAGVDENWIEVKTLVYWDSEFTIKMSNEPWYYYRWWDEPANNNWSTNPTDGTEHNSDWWWNTNTWEEKQWPCPEWYHVPSGKERIDFATGLCLYEDVCTDSDRGYDPLSRFAIIDNNDWLTSILKNEFNINNLGTRYWSSTPGIWDSSAWAFRIEMGTIGFDDNGRQRNTAQVVRCFRNSVLIPPIVTLSFLDNGTEIYSWSVFSWDYRNEGIPVPEERDWYQFDYRYADGDPDWEFDFWGLITEDATLYAKFTPIEYKVDYELHEGVVSWENATWYTIESDDIILINPNKTGYTFIWRSGTDIDGISTLVTIPSGSTWDRNYEANWEINEYTITFVDWSWTETDVIYTWAYESTVTTGYPEWTKEWYTIHWDKEIPATMPLSWDVITASWTINKYTITLDIDGNITIITWDYGSPITAPANPTKNGYTFKWREPEILATMPAEDMTIKAKWEKNWSSGWWWGWWGGGWSSKTSDKDKDTTNNPSVTDVTAPLESGAQWDSNDGSPLSRGDTASAERGSTQNYTQEFQDAYEFAHEKWITTMPTIQEAQMDWKLTRIAMAKMLSQYAMNVLWQKPANIVTPKFNDVTDKQNSDYDDWVTLAYQLWIMWQNMPNNKFRPNDEVTRAEFATALSRMLYHTSDWEYKSTDKFYTNHMKKLVQEWIITNDDAKMKELRGYVMIMLMRSAK